MLTPTTPLPPPGLDFPEGLPAPVSCSTLGVPEWSKKKGSSEDNVRTFWRMQRSRGTLTVIGCCARFSSCWKALTCMWWARVWESLCCGLRDSQFDNKLYVKKEYDDWLNVEVKEKVKLRIMIRWLAWAALWVNDRGEGSWEEHDEFGGGNVDFEFPVGQPNRGVF